MDAEAARTFLLSLPHVVETRQWGDNLVFWVGDTAIGGKMFCLLNLDAGMHSVASYSAGPERYFDLLERDDLKPAPYMARIHWIAAERWTAWRNAEWKEEFRAAHAITFGKLPKRMRSDMMLPAANRERTPLLAEPAQRKAAQRKAEKRKQ